MDRLLHIEGLEIEAVGSNEKWKPIVNGISLSVDRGEVLGLIGESGAGKSTIGLAAMGYTRTGCRISGGSIKFDGIDLRSSSKKYLRKMHGVRIAYVAQSAAASFNPAQKLINQFVEGPVQHGIMSAGDARDKAYRLFNRLELPEPENFGNRYPHQVSGGQLQRAMIAMAMSCDPDLIVFDEPTTALDVTTQIEVLAAIKEVCSELNTAGIYITHDLAVVSQVANRIMVLRHGELVEEGCTRHIIDKPAREYTRRLLNVRNLRNRKKIDSESTDTLLQVDNLTAGYTKGTNVLENINIKIPRGRTVAVVGESGSGKSTLARSIVGLLAPSKGSILFDGQEIPAALENRNRDTLRRLQLIYQMPDTALNPRQKIRMILGRPLSFYFGLEGAEKETRISELLEMIELPERYKERYPSELSGGEKQRVCIARALAAKPELIICDEVTSALDQLVAEEILKLLQKLQNEFNVSYIFITHDLATVKAISDDIVVMLQGKVVENGPREQVLTPPHHAYTDLLLSSVPEMDPGWLDNLLIQRELDKSKEFVN